MLTPAVVMATQMRGGELPSGEFERLVGVAEGAMMTYHEPEPAATTTTTRPPVEVIEHRPPATTTTSYVPPPELAPRDINEACNTATDNLRESGRKVTPEDVGKCVEELTALAGVTERNLAAAIDTALKN